MAGMVSRRRFVIGRDVQVVDSKGPDVLIEGAVRLRPGSLVDLCDSEVRTALVLTWAVARLGKDGPTFRGRCRWEQSHG